MHIAKTSLVLRSPAPAPRAGAYGGFRAHHAFALATASGAFSLWAAQQHRLPALCTVNGRHAARRKPAISWLAVDALSGAIGEIASLVVLYPLDSLKVLCQARGASAAAVLADLRALGGARAARQLYAGCGSAALCSAAIGAIYLLAFYSAKRLGAAAVAGGALRNTTQRQQQLRQQRQGEQPASTHNAAASATGSKLTADSSSSASQDPELSSEGTHPVVASLAGVAASLAGSVFEAPMEMFKLRTQAGALEGSMLRTMLREASTRGLGSLYATYGAFMLKSIPYDVAELATYSQMCDWRAAAAEGAGSASKGPPGLEQQQQRRSQGALGWQQQLGGLLAAMPDSTGDMLIGAAAGVASVLISMPCDVIKTRMDLAPPSCPPGNAGGVLCSTRAFFQTGRQLVAAGGPQALFVGVTPRLLQNVPSCMVYWAAVEGTRRFMLRHFEVQGAAPADVAAEAGSVHSGASSSSMHSSGSMHSSRSVAGSSSDVADSIVQSSTNASDLANSSLPSSSSSNQSSSAGGSASGWASGSRSGSIGVRAVAPAPSPRAPVLPVAVPLPVPIPSIV